MLARRAVTAIVAAGAVACAIGETRHETVTEPAPLTSATQSCDGAFAHVDVQTLTPCQDGKGHCYDGAKVGLTGLPPCSGSDVCVPDKVLTADGQKLKACTFFIVGKPGACLSTLVSDVAAHQDQLQKDVCADDERCVPCVDPTNGHDTHVCEATGVYEKACAKGTSAAPRACCHGAGTCLNKDAVPEDQQSSLSPDGCPRQELCAPASLVSGKPVACHAVGLSGVCIDVCFAGLLQAAGTLLRGDCQASEVCLPCAVGASEGVPGC